MTSTDIKNLVDMNSIREEGDNLFDKVFIAPFVNKYYEQVVVADILEDMGWEQSRVSNVISEMELGVNADVEFQLNLHLYISVDDRVAFFKEPIDSNELISDLIHNSAVVKMGVIESIRELVGFAVEGNSVVYIDDLRDGEYRGVFLQEDNKPSFMATIKDIFDYRNKEIDIIPIQ